MAEQAGLEPADREIRSPAFRAGTIPILLTAPYGSSDQIRTDDPVVNSHMLYQLSYRGKFMAGRMGFEPMRPHHDAFRFSRPAQSAALPSPRIWRQRQDSNLHVLADHRLSKPDGYQLPNSGVWRKGRDSNPHNGKTRRQLSGLLPYHSAHLSVITNSII